MCAHTTAAQLARSDHTQLLAASLRVTTNIFDTMRPHLKLQQELFLSFLLDRLVLPASGSAPSLRKVELETQLDRSTWAQDLVDPNERASTPTAGSLRDRDRDRHGAASETRELMLEILSHFVRGKHAATDLWVNYDCNVEGEDVLERLVKFLSRVRRAHTSTDRSRTLIIVLHRGSLHRNRLPGRLCKTRPSSCASTRFSTWSPIWLREQTP